MSKSTKIQKTYNILIRVLILVVTYGFIYKKVFMGKDWLRNLIVFESYFKDWKFFATIILLVGLMFLNWGIESIKWRFLISKIEKLSLFQSIQAVFSGASISIITPNRVGEYFARVFILEKASHIQGILITILGSRSQLLITILAGTTGLILFSIGFASRVSLMVGSLYYVLLVILVIFDCLLLYFYFNVSYLALWREKLMKNRFKKFRKFFVVFSYFQHGDLCYVITLSFFRYVVFSLQYYILLRFFSVPVPFFQSLILTSVIFFVITLVPTIALTELGVRDSAALYFFGIFFSETGSLDDSLKVGILLASTMLWIINLVAPAIIGTVFVNRLKFFRKDEPEPTSEGS